MNDALQVGEVFSGFDRACMLRALEQAALAEAEGEVPVGAVLVHEARSVAVGRNRNISLNDPTAHAEIMALRAAGEALGNYRFPGCTVFVTLEPCAMCVGAMIHARIARVVFAAPDPKTGALGGAYDLQDVSAHNHRMDVQGGLLAEQASARLRAFFRERRRSTP